MSMNVNARLTANVPQVAAIAFRDAMRQLPGGVSVITAGIGEDRSGMTVTSVSSMAIDPPSIIVCVNRQSSTWPLLQCYRAFGVNIPRRRPAGGGGSIYREKRIEGTGAFCRCPVDHAGQRRWLLSDALAVLDCEIEELIDRHSHSLVIGRASAVRVAEGPAGLVYWRGRYSGTTDPALGAGNGG
jgi:flavin reductase (DIM6/NTAB) family NADH-FMN oxidoreductase RutF